MPVLGPCPDSDPGTLEWIQIRIQIATKLPLLQSPAVAEAAPRTPVMREPCMFFKDCFSVITM